MPIDTPANFFFATVTAPFTSSSLELTLSTVANLNSPGFLVLFNYTANRQGPPVGDPTTNGVEVLRYDGINVGNKKVTLSGASLRGQDGTTAINPTAGATYAVVQDSVAAFILQIANRLPEVDATGKLWAFGTTNDATERLGIGTASPSSPLHIATNGSAVIRVEDTSGASENPHIRLIGGAEHLILEGVENSTQGRLYGSTGYDLALGAGNTTDVVRLLSGALSESIRVRSSGVMSLVPTSAAADGDLANSELHFSVDEGGNNLRIKVKYSGGTVKTATVALT